MAGRSVMRIGKSFREEETSMKKTIGLIAACVGASALAIGGGAVAHADPATQSDPACKIFEQSYGNFWRATGWSPLWGTGAGKDYQLVDCNQVGSDNWTFTGMTGQSLTDGGLNFIRIACNPAMNPQMGAVGNRFCENGHYNGPFDRFP